MSGVFCGGDCSAIPRTDNADSTAASISEVYASGGGMISPETAPIMINDLRYTARMLRKSPLFTLAVVLTVALGIGANTAIFSVVNAVMLRPLPYEQPDRLVWIAEKNDKLNIPTFAASLLNYLEWKERSRTFDTLAAFGFATFNLTDTGDPEQLTGG